MVQIVAKIVGIVAPVCLAVISQEHDPEITAIRDKGLQDKGERKTAEGGVGKHLFNRRPEMHTHAAILTVKLGDHGSDTVLLIIGYCRNHVMMSVNGASQGQHEWAQNGSLQGFGAAGELREA